MEITSPTYSTNESNIWPKITIITPSFNQGQFIEQTIQSVLKQDYPNLEYIIIDGGSTDNTVDVIKKYEEHITFWVSEKDRGQSHAINKGLIKCTGDIVNWLNSDDWLMPGALHKIASIFRDNPNVMVVSGYENHIWPDGRVELSEGTCLSNSLEETIELCQIDQPSTFFRASAFKNITPVPEDMHYIMDGEIWVRFLLLYGHNCFYKINEPIVNFRLHENSKTISNAVVDNFLIERSSIIIDLQRFIGLPEKMIQVGLMYKYKNATIKRLQRSWKISDEELIKRLNLYFSQKNINLCFIKNDYKNARLCLLDYLRLFNIDVFLLKSYIKLIVNRFL